MKIYFYILHDVKTRTDQDGHIFVHAMLRIKAKHERALGSLM